MHQENENFLYLNIFEKMAEYALGNMKNFNAKMFSNINIKQIAVIAYLQKRF